MSMILQQGRRGSYVTQSKTYHLRYIALHSNGYYFAVFERISVYGKYDTYTSNNIARYSVSEL